jgi:hypothetical protein
MLVVYENLPTARTPGESRETTMNAIITEAGNGLPGCGETVYDSDDNTLYRIVTPDAQIRIETGRSSGAGNWIEVEVEDVGEPSDLTEEEWNALPDCGVLIVERSKS